MSSKQQLLLTPGPTGVPQRILDAMSVPMIHHRTQDFVSLFERVNQGLKKIFLTEGDVVTLSSSGTGAMETAIINLLSRGDKVIACPAGKFGERFRDIAKAYEMNVVELNIPYGEAVKPEDVQKALQDHPDAKAVLVTLLETSTGAVKPVEAVASITRNQDAILMVDAVSGLV